MEFLRVYADLLARPSVNLRSAREVELWTDALGIYTADLVLAVSEVGTSSEKVFEYLQAQGIPGRRAAVVAGSAQ